MPRFTVLLLVFFCFFKLEKAKAAKILPEASACFFGDLVESKGFDVTYYSYPYGETSRYSQTDFLASLYTTQPLLSSASGVSDLSVSWETRKNTVYYGMTVPTSNFIFEYTGFFSRMFYFL